MAKNGPRVAILVENMYQEMEVWYPIFRFQEAGAKVTIFGPEKAKYTSKLGYPCQADAAAETARAEDFDVVIVPGGFAPDLMRLCKPMISFVREMSAQGKIVGAICHGTWILVSAGILKDRRATGAPSIADDITNAGGRYEDLDVIRDGHIITSRKPADIPAFSAALVQAVAERRRPEFA